MRWSFLLFAPLLAFAAVPAEAQIGPRLRSLARSPGPDRPVMTVWQKTPPQGSGPCVGRVCVTRVNPEDLDQLTSAPGLQYASLPVRYRMRLDRAAAQLELPGAREHSGLSGAGVLVAVIDTGLDFTHPDFLDDQGRTRVAWLLDQTRAPEGRFLELEELGNGAVYSAADLQEVIDGTGGPALGAGRDAIGHGTHVAGIAASNHPLYRGPAPGCRLVVVKAFDKERAGFEEDQVLLALAFADRVAQLEKQPLVINLSLGSQMGAHDGSEPLELALSRIAEQPGRAVTVAAGNEAGRHQHARGAVSARGSKLAFSVSVPYYHWENPASLVTDFWFDGDEDLQVQVETPSGHLSEVVSPGGPVGLESWTPDGFVEFVCQAQPNPESQAHRVLLTLKGEPGQPLQPGSYRILFSGSAHRVDGWIADFDLPGAWAEAQFNHHVDPGNLVGPPATARGVIAVGAYNARSGWVDLEGATRNNPDPLDALSPYSVSGPTRDGRMKPELVAPGTAVASSLSIDSDPRSLDSIFYFGGSLQKVVEDGRHAISSGTSMAAPLVAGLAAQLLERNPDLTGFQVRDLLVTTTRHDAATGLGALFAPNWGFGKANALRLVQTIENPEGLHFDPQESLCGASVRWLPSDRRFRATISAVPRDANGLPLGAGQQVDIQIPGATFHSEVIDHQNGIYTRTLLGTGHRGTDLSVICRANQGTFQSTPKIRLAASHLEHSGSGMIGGACSCTGTGYAEASVFVLFFLIPGLFCRGGGSRHQVGDSVLTRPNRP